MQSVRVRAKGYLCLMVASAVKTALAKAKALKAKLGRLGKVHNTNVNMLCLKFASFCLNQICAGPKMIWVHLNLLKVL